MHAGPPLDVPAVPLPLFVLDGAAARGDKPALIDGPTGRVLTYAALAQGVDRLAVSEAAGRALAVVWPPALTAWAEADMAAGRAWGRRALAAEHAGTEPGAVGLGWLARLAAGEGDEAGALGHLTALWDAAPTSGAFAESAAVVAAAFPDADLGWIPAARGAIGGKTDAGTETRLAVWPNPTGGASRLTVPTTAGETLDVDIYDGLGRRVAVVAERAVATGAALEASLPTETLPPGVYLVRVVRHGAGSEAAVSVARLTVAR